MPHHGNEGTKTRSPGKGPVLGCTLQGMDARLSVIDLLPLIELRCVYNVCGL